jgi:hypothetical protein
MQTAEELQIRTSACLAHFMACAVPRAAATEILRVLDISVGLTIPLAQLAFASKVDARPD